MHIVLGILLFINAIFNFVTWPQFLKRVSADPRARDAGGKATPFLKVHIVLVTVAMVIGVVSVVAAALNFAGIW